MFFAASAKAKGALGAMQYPTLDFCQEKYFFYSYDPFAFYFNL